VSYQVWGLVNTDGTVASTMMTPQDMHAVDPGNGQHWQPMPRNARSRKKWLWVGELSPTGWEQRHHGRVTVDDYRLEPDGESFATVMVVIDGTERLTACALEINGEPVTVDSETPLEVGRTTESGSYRIKLVDPRIYGTPSELLREVVVMPSEVTHAEI